MGKLPDRELKALLNCIKKGSRVIVPPTVGYDSGVHLLGDKCLVISTDPCIGVPEKWFGWFLINYAASDVSVFGAKPQYAAINLLAPTRTKTEVFEKVMKQACKAATELNIAIITGHTGTYEGLSTVVGTCTVYGTVRRNDLVTPGGAKPGDCIVCSKPIGLETLVNFSLTERKLASALFGHEAALSLTREVKMQTCVNEALLLAEIGGVSAMHDATEGGFVSALNEMTNASKIGFTVDFAELPILTEMRKLAEHFGLNWRQVLAMSSAGTLLAAVSPNHREEAIRALSSLGLKGKVVGAFTEDKSRVIRINGKEVGFPETAADPYAEIVGRR